MRYTVLWSAEAERELTALWMNSSGRAATTRAADEIDKLLAQDAEQRGESRDMGRRILLVPPLGVKFRARIDEGTVLVLSVWRFETRGED